MSKAEEKAFKVYPKMSRITEPHGVISADDVSHYIGDANAERREGFIEGYRQAEKDLALTRDDIELIGNLLIASWHMPSGEDIYEEVLKRFNESKEK